ncbi:MFS general substrate transporter [Daedalea quercina L-15889]|uniref:MFS general substrate transporter n=1 Tax=Daedalea quercina L-15889 TaxID=1314783 RepID=A0A165MBU5_9APHY|nr:MFS general substrate transporter [Daedalea quercina L-15889]
MLVDEEAANPVPLSRSESIKSEQKQDEKGIEVQCEPTEARYPGSGTAEDPYIVDWETDDPENPYNWSTARRWTLTFELAYATWVSSFCSSSYSAGLHYSAVDLHVSEEVALLGISLFVLGFMVGPLLWAPLSEMYGRRIVFIVSYAAFTLLHLGGALCKNIATLLATRTLAGMFGVSPFTNSGAALADLWLPRDRGVASSLYASAPFLGPVVGPIIGGWVAMSHLGWRFNFWIMFMVSAYAPVLLRWRARKLRRASGGKVIYVSRFDVDRPSDRVAHFRANLSRPFLFLATEPIVLLFAMYVAVAYAILYAFFAMYPIVFQQQRGWSPGLGGLAFIGVGVGTTFGMCLAPLQNRLYWAAMAKSPTGRAPPEARLYSPMFGAVCLPVGLFWFAWTCTPKHHWILPIAAGAPFGCGVALVMQGVTQYLMDAYQIYAASALAATVVLRSICACFFPLVIPIMYRNLGDHWAGTVFAILTALCMPLPWLFWAYGPAIRKRSRYAIKDAVPSVITKNIDQKIAAAQPNTL